MENTIIRVITKNSYGVDRVYPLNFKEPLYNLTGQKTLSGKQRQALKERIKELKFTLNLELTR